MEVYADYAAPQFSKNRSRDAMMEIYKEHMVIHLLFTQ